jgi:histidine triad (HIT) family protein
VAGDVPSKEAASTKETYAFYDIAPAAPVHVLVVPRRHITDAAAIGLEHGDVLAEMFTTAQTVARAHGLDSGYRLMFNVGPDALNSVPHLHLHLLGGRQMDWPPGTGQVA